MGTPFRRALSRSVGWLADRELPRPLRAPVYRAYARATGADLSEVRLALTEHPSLGAFFARRLKDGVRTIERDPRLFVSPVDGTVQHIGRIEDGTLLQAKGRSYALAELLGDRADPDFVGGSAWTIYLSPRDYHRIHAHERCTLTRAHWLAGALYSVAPKVLARRLVLPINERVALRLECTRGPFWLVLVGATNVGRMRVVGLEQGREGAIEPPLAFERGAELARFEMGSTIVLLAPRGLATPLEGLAPGTSVRLGQPIGRYLAP